MDATDQASVIKGFADAAAEFGATPEVLVYNVGGGGFGISIMDIDPAAFAKSFELSCLGRYELI